MTSPLMIPRQERPRERMARYGACGVSTLELLAILLGSGTKNHSVLELSAEILAHFGSVKKLSEASITELMQVKGIKSAKALQIQAAFALFSRLEEEPIRLKLKTPEDVYRAIRLDLEKEPTEILMLVLRDVKKTLIHREILGRGTLTELLVHPREVFHAAIRHRAHSAIIAHNHPSGDPTPSTKDLEMTELLASAGRIIGIELIDHLIVGKSAFVSLFKQGFFSRDTY